MTVGVLSHPILKIPLLTGIPSRGITAETCTEFGTYATGTPLEILQSYIPYDGDEGGQPIGYKIRKGGWTVGKKETRWLPGSERCLYGEHLWDGEWKPVYLCEGETDVMSLHQHLKGEGVDALVLGLGGAPTPDQWLKWTKFVARVTGGEFKVYSCFDNDTPGQEYHDKLVSYLPNADIETLYFSPDCEYKDVSELLEAGQPLQFVGFSFPPELVEGEALLTADDMLERETTSTGFPPLDILMGGGWYPGKLVVVAGAPKNGKSTFVCDLVARQLAQDKRVLFIPLELTYQETMTFLASVSVGIHHTDISLEKLNEAKAALLGNLSMIRHHGYTAIKDMAKWLDTASKWGADMVVLDHITSACTSYDEGLTTSLLDSMISLIKAKCNEHGYSALVVTHVNAGNEEGKPVTVKQLRGSQSLAQLPDVVLGVRRCESGVTEVHTVTVDRFAGINGRVVFEFNGRFNAMYKTTTGL
jgi:archaellum biogenesis ATPase FlaH